jgi:GNAT superfamily N-acetyltransferase
VTGFAVREATGDDRPVVEDFERRVRDEALRFRGGLVHVGELSGPDGRFTATRVLVASDVVSRGIVGVAWLSLNERDCRIDAVHVDESARGLGCGRALVMACRDLASADGRGRIDALALPGDRATKNLYERVGMTARRIVASTELPVSDPASSEPASR